MPEPTCAALFVSETGARLTGSAFTKMANRHVRAADLGKNASGRVFPHSAARAMLENGANIRFIREMLGHAKLTSTQAYMRVGITKLNAVHDEPTDRPEGEEVALVPLDEVLVSGGDYLDDEERERLHESLREGIRQMKAGQRVDAATAFAHLRAHR